MKEKEKKKTVTVTEEKRKEIDARREKLMEKIIDFDESNKEEKED